jgi:hypothetical protein
MPVITVTKALPDTNCKIKIGIRKMLTILKFHANTMQRISWFAVNNRTTLRVADVKGNDPLVVGSRNAVHHFVPLEHTNHGTSRNVHWSV